MSLDFLSNSHQKMKDTVLSKTTKYKYSLNFENQFSSSSTHNSLFSSLTQQLVWRMILSRLCLDVATKRKQKRSNIQKVINRGQEVGLFLPIHRSQNASSWKSSTKETSALTRSCFFCFVFFPLKLYIKNRVFNTPITDVKELQTKIQAAGMQNILKDKQRKLVVSTSNTQRQRCNSLFTNPPITKCLVQKIKYKGNLCTHQILLLLIFFPF